ncbi:sensor histidine kinase [Allosphingosinicella vermicomposti]|uniref:sensor histidine kinase n=1 Tax=Allosphingosinicella vermicomposti TaxID=614671 RepID=UPI000D113FAC|nr:histidine kinase [Allosphingosinicella vermicomposti]
MTRQLRRFRSHAPTRFAIVLWCFVNLLSDLVTVMIGRGPPFLMFLSSIPVFLAGVACTLLLNKLRKALAKRPGIQYWPAMLVLLAGCSIAVACIDILQTRWVALAFYSPWQNWGLDMSLQRMLTIAVIYFWVFSFAMALLWAGSVSDMARYNAAKVAAMEAAALRAEATALRFQLNPHFLFNTLNSIASTITTGSRQDAENMVVRLASFLRASFASDPAKTIMLDEEIAAMEAYLDIEKVRFGERMIVEIGIDEAIEEALVPHFILQPLVENAVKHGVARTSSPIRICMSAAQNRDRLILRVTNEAVDNSVAGPMPPRPALSSIGLGLDNIRQRLALSYDDAALRTTVTPSGFIAEIELPLALSEGEPLLHAAE